MNTWKRKYLALEADWKDRNRKHAQERDRLREEILYLRGVLRSMSVVVRDLADGEHVDFFEVRRPTTNKES